MTETTKGTWRRPICDKELADLGEQIWREKDPERKAELVAKWNELKWRNALQRTGEWKPHD